MASFTVDWYPGPSAQLEVFSPPASKAGLYQLKYTSPYRPTLRPPAERRPLGGTELDPIHAGLNDLVNKLGIAGARGGDKSAAGAAAAGIDNRVRMVGGQLLDLIVPMYVQVDLRASELFLEIGVDEKLLGFPWELMHDGHEFLCLKHLMGRFVNATVASPPSNQAVSWLDNKHAGLSILVISVPKPLDRDSLSFEALPGAEAETKAIVEALDKVPGVEVNLLWGKQATFDNVYSALKEKNYQVLHYNGHALFNEKEPKRSGLVLHNQDMTTGQLVSFLTNRPPVLAFVNACETGKVTVWKDQYNIYGVAQAILQTGAYLLGSRWLLSDSSAALFAKTFYGGWLAKEMPLGAAIRDARLACRAKAEPEDLAWASYVFYGDPRVYFRVGNDAPSEPARSPRVNRRIA